MKKMMMALAALCVAGAASAVTINWGTGTSIGADETATISQVVKSTFSVALVFDGTPDASTEILKIVNEGTGNPIYVSVKTDGNGSPQGGLYYNNNNNTETGSYAFTSATFKEKGNVLGIVFTFQDGVISFDYYLNGELLNPDGARFSQGIATGNYTQLVSAVDGTYYIASGAATEADFAALPEPTALALLALGVAGLALRRKAV